MISPLARFAPLVVGVACTAPHHGPTASGSAAPRVGTQGPQPSTRTPRASVSSTPARTPQIATAPKTLAQPAAAASATSAFAACAPPRGLAAEPVLDAAITSMIVQQGEVVVLTESTQVYRFHDERWVRLDAGAKEPFLRRLSERTGEAIQALALLPGPKSEPWVATISASGEDATVAMDNMHLTLYSIGANGWKREPLPSKLKLPPANHGALSAVTSGTPALCSEGTGGSFCLIYGDQGWQAPELRGIGLPSSIRWVNGSLVGVANNQWVKLASGVESARLTFPAGVNSVQHFLGDASEFWATDSSRKLIHNQTLVDSPVGEVKVLWAWSPKEVWIGGVEGVAYYDGSALKRVNGVSGSIEAIVGTSENSVWFAGSEGVFRLRPRSADIENLPETQEPPATMADKAKPIAAGTARLLRGQPLSLTNAGRLDFDNALFVQVSSPKRVTFVNYEGVYSHEIGSSRVERAADADGNSVALGSNIIGSQPSPCETKYGEPREPFVAALHRDNGKAQAWLRPDKRPMLNLCRAAALTRVPLFEFTAGDLALTSSNHVWLAGARSHMKSGPKQRVFPQGEGVLLDWSETGLALFRVVQGPLFAVTASGDTTWAAGADGLVVRVQNGKMDLYQLEPKRTFWDALIDTTGVWLVGEGRDLVYFDGNEQIRYQGNPLASPLTSIARDDEGQLWIAGPNSLFRASPAQLTSKD